MRLRTILVDDEAPALDRLRMLLSADPQVEILAECRNGTEAVEAIQRLAPDLVFLDIQMPGKDGFEVLADLASVAAPLVVFVTAYDEYAVKAFEVRALDYLLKPFDRERVLQTLLRARRELGTGNQKRFQEKVLELLADRSVNRFLSRVLVRSAGRYTFLKVSEIDWIETQGNYIRIHSGKKSWLLRETMNSFEARLDPDEFLRTHRGHMVRISGIREIEEGFQGSGCVVMTDGTRVPLSRRHRRRLPRFAE